MRCVNREMPAFIAVGIANALLSYALYVFLLMFFPYVISYSLAYVTGIALSYGLNTVFVFRQPLSWGKALRFPAVYAVQYALGVVMLWVFVEGFFVDPCIAPLLVIAATVPVTFILARLVIRGSVSRCAADEGPGHGAG